MKSYLKGIRAAFLRKVVTLDYAWIAKPRIDQSKPIFVELDQLFASHAQQYDPVLNQIIQLFDQLNTISEKGTDDKAVYWKNNYLPGLDLASLYAITTLLNPGHIIEIGSGHTTAVMRKAINDGPLQSRITCIDPNPRRLLSDLADKHVRVALESLDSYTMFQTLSPGDIVFFDGSHISMANTDVTVFFMEILPRIPAGVYVHIHDVYLPYDYPPDMVLRGYNEQYLLAQALLYNMDKFEIIFPAFWISKQPAHTEHLTRNLWSRLNVMEIETHGGSFWFKILR
ncbi:MAG: class I SAM-dependent methyltransferase [Saprospiraceae bacterium]|nr:class I SAM-dependent methyltransferase [Saprospiraceae bacterium]